jgi:hypothetical protein
MAHYIPNVGSLPDVWRKVEPMSNKIAIALLLAVALSPASALASSKHPVRHQAALAVERQARGNSAYGYVGQNPPSVREPAYIWVQDQGVANGD